MQPIHSTLFTLLRSALAASDTPGTPDCPGTSDSLTMLSPSDWHTLYDLSRQQSLTAIIYHAVSHMQLPLSLAMQWMTEAEAIRGANVLQNREASRLTALFAQSGRHTAILKGQANALLYPDKLSRQPGDIDLWVEGGKDSVSQLLITLGLLDRIPTIANAGKNDKATTSYHHIHLPPTPDGVVIEVHFRPSSGNHNPFTNRRLQRWLEHEITLSAPVSEGFCVPTIPFALVMQLSHIQRHFLSGGIGLRQLCDYYLLLRHATDADRHQVTPLLRPFGLHHTAAALMWILSYVLHLDTTLMLCPPDTRRGQWLLREVMSGGNFGHYAPRQHQGILRRVLQGRLRQFRLLRFDFWESLWSEFSYWHTVIITIPERLRRHRLSLSDPSAF